MKRRIKLWAAYMMILCMCTAIILPNKIAPVSAAETGTLEISEFRVFKGDTQLSTDTANVSVADGDRLSVSMEWSIPNNDTIHKVFSAKLDYRNLKFMEGQEVDLKLPTDDVVGTLRFENGTVTATFTDEGYLNGFINRDGGATIDAVADIYAGSKYNNTEQLITINGKDFKVKYDSRNSGSSVWLQKGADGAIYKEGGKYKQKYKISIGASGSSVTDLSLTDIPGSGLGNPGNITVTYSDVSGIAVNDEMSLTDLDNRLSTMGKDQKLEFTYVMDVADTVYEQITDGNRDKYKNTFRVDYKDADSNSRTAECSADVRAYRPVVSKAGEIVYGADGRPEKILWNINIDLNELKDTQIAENSITDTMLSGASDKRFETHRDAEGKITGYTLTYETAVDADADWSYSDKEWVNTVTVPIGGYNYVQTGKAVLPAKRWVSKEFIGIDPDVGKLTWRIDVGPIPAGITSVSVSDIIDSAGGWHEFEPQSGYIEADGIKTAIGYQDNSVPQDVYETGYGKFVFSDSFVARMAGKTVSIYVDTLIRDGGAAGIVYGNKAQLSYTLDGRNTTMESRACYSREVEASAISKFGTPDRGNTAINYTLRINLKELVLAEGTPIIVRDILPAGLILDEGSCRATAVHWYSENTFWNDDSILNTSVVPEVSGRTALFTIPVSSQMADAVNDIQGNGSGEWCGIELKYTAAVSDIRQYIKDNTEVTYENSASAEYNGSDIGRATDIIRMSPKEILSKRQEYNNSRPYIEYEIRVNPYKLDLTDGQLILTDKLGDALIYCLDTVKVQKYNQNGVLEELTAGSGYRYRYDEDANSIVFTLPDEESLVITYSAYVNLYFDVDPDKNGWLTDDNSFNEASLSGYESCSGSKRVSYSKRAITPAGWAHHEDTKDITLTKIYNSGRGTTTLPGCKFKLVEYSLAGGKLQAGNTAADNIVVGSDGNVVIGGVIRPLQLYGLVETAVPADSGCKINSEPLYFIVIGDSDPALYRYPAGYDVKYVNDGARLIFKNVLENEEPEPAQPSESEQESVKPSGSEPENEPSEPSGSGEDTKPSETGTNDRNGDVEGEQNNHNKPSKPAEGEEPEGGEDPNGRNPDLEGDGSLVGTSDSSYIKILLAFLILSVIAAAGTEITILCFEKEK